MEEEGSHISKRNLSQELAATESSKRKDALIDFYLSGAADGPALRKLMLFSNLPKDTISTTQSDSHLAIVDDPENTHMGYNEGYVLKGRTETGVPIAIKKAKTREGKRYDPAKMVSAQYDLLATVDTDITIFPTVYDKTLDMGGNVDGYTMEYIDGVTLYDAQTGTVTQEMADEAVSQLELFHKKARRTHADMKADNIIVQTDENGLPSKIRLVDPMVVISYNEVHESARVYGYEGDLPLRQEEELQKFKQLLQGKMR